MIPFALFRNFSLLAPSIWMGLIAALEAIYGLKFKQYHYEENQPLQATADSARWSGSCRQST